MFPRKYRLLQMLFPLMLTALILPILFNIFISRAYQASPSTSNMVLDPFPLYVAPGRGEQLSSNPLDLTTNVSNYLRSLSGSSLEEQIAYGFADLTNRQRYAESYASERRQEINQLMKEIRYLWGLVQQQNDAARVAAQKENSINSNGVSTESSVPAAQGANEGLNLAEFSMQSNEFMHIPSIFSLEPFVHSSAQSLRSISPVLRIASKARSASPVRFVFGIPTVKRTVESYLVATLQNLIANLSPSEQAQACFVVLIAETDKEFVEKTASQIVSQFPREIRRGLIEIISPPASYYPNMTSLRPTLGDTMERVRWRSKQNLDFAYLMMYCQSKGVYYIQLEDDIITKPFYLSNMQAFVTKQTLQRSNDWIILDFCSLGFIGKMFKSADLSQLILFFTIFYNDKPIDWLLDNYVTTKVCSLDMDIKACKKQKELIWILHKPSLFQHVGTHSSLKGKIQKLKDKGFGKVKLFIPHLDNPPAKVYTSVQEYRHYRLNDAYAGTNYFWGFSPIKGDLIGFQFEQPTNLEKVLIRSGNLEHPGDILINSTLQIRTAQQELLLSSSKYARTEDGFINFGAITDGFVSALVPSELNPIEEVRIRYHNNCSHWIIISEIYMRTLEMAATTTTTTVS